MNDLLDKYSAKYHLQLGDHKFSPLLTVTAGVSLEYCELIKDNIGLKEPLIFCFPEKKAGALWTSVSYFDQLFPRRLCKYW
ncbi:MAG: hypothetical protein IPI60_00325 [Saprospiraceae bacterium]|nr:hypothetical protein [Saprospiraceae bacterium]